MKSEKAIKNREQLKLLESEPSRHKGATKMEIPLVLSKLFELNPLEVNRSESLENLAEKVLNHYYRRLHPGQVIARFLSSAGNHQLYAAITVLTMSYGPCESTSL